MSPREDAPFWPQPATHRSNPPPSALRRRRSYMRIASAWQTRRLGSTRPAGPRRFHRDYRSRRGKQVSAGRYRGKPAARPAAHGTRRRPGVCPSDDVDGRERVLVNLCRHWCSLSELADRAARRLQPVDRTEVCRQYRRRGQDSALGRVNPRNAAAVTGSSAYGEKDSGAIRRTTRPSCRACSSIAGLCSSPSGRPSTLSPTAIIVSTAFSSRISPRP